MKVKQRFRPMDLARAVGVSAQTVRKYERWGFLPPAERTSTGYRRYTERHLHALRVARTAIVGYGWQPALALLRQIHAADLAAAYAAVDAAHAALHRERQDVEAMLTALRAGANALSLPESATQSPSMLVGEAARQAGVRVSALRFWEQQGLLRPPRDQTSRYRRYGQEQCRELQVVVLLRKADYDFPAIRMVLEQLRSGQPDKAVQAAERRLADLSAISRRRIAATAAIWRYVETLSAE